MRILKTPFAAFVLAALIGVLAGCGGVSSKTRQLTRAELIAKADPICERVISEVDWSKVTTEELPHVVGRLAALEERAAAELEKLTPPTSMLGLWRLIVDGFRLTGSDFRTISKFIQKAGAQAYPTVPLSNAQHERGLDAHIAGIMGCVPY